MSMQITREEYSKIFFHRHDFEDDDLKKLKAFFPHTHFSNNIPTAWIIWLDELCRKVSILGAQQVGGQLFIDSYDSLSDEEKKLVNYYESKMYEADCDLKKVSKN